MKIKRFTTKAFERLLPEKPDLFDLKSTHRHLVRIFMDDWTYGEGRSFYDLVFCNQEDIYDDFIHFCHQRKHWSEDKWDDRQEYLLVQQLSHWRINEVHEHLKNHIKFYVIAELKEMLDGFVSLRKINNVAYGPVRGDQ